MGTFLGWQSSRSTTKLHHDGSGGARNERRTKFKPGRTYFARYITRPALQCHKVRRDRYFMFFELDCLGYTMRSIATTKSEQPEIARRHHTSPLNGMISGNDCEHPFLRTASVHTDGCLRRVVTDRTAPRPASTGSSSVHRQTFGSMRRSTWRWLVGWRRSVRYVHHR